MSSTDTDLSPEDRDPRHLLKSALPPKTIAGFAAAFIAILAVAAVSYRAQTARRDGAERMSESASFLLGLETLLSTMKDAETGQRGYLLVGEEPYLEPYHAAVARIDAELARLRPHARELPGQEERLAAAERLIRTRLGQLAQRIELRRAGRLDEALDFVRSGDGKRTMDQLRDVLAELSAAARARRDEQTAAWEQLAATATFVAGAGSLLLLVLIAIAAAMTSRDFRAQRREAWLRQADAAIAARLAGDPSRAELGDRTAAVLARYLDAPVVAVYAPATADRLARLGGYGLPEPAPDAPAVAGLLRQVLKDGALAQLRDVPADYLTVTSGLGAARPRHLVLAPAAAAAGEVHAVVEVGLLRPPAPHDLELLRRAGEPIAVALRTAALRDERRALLEQTQQQAEELQAQQEELRVQNEELEQQSRVLQDSQSRLENQQAELEQINASLEEQTQTLEQQRDSVQRAQREAQRANAYKSEFLANMSHELRTPLNSSLILAKLLSDNRGGNLTEEQVKFARTIYSAGNDLLTLINDILDLSKIEAGKLDVRPESIALPRLADELTSTFAPIARDKGLELSIAIEDGAPAAMRTDPTRLLQILKNLISNALKFTDRGGVTLRARGAAGGRVAFDVRDTGIGIAPEQHEVIFQAFRQADGTTNRKYGGTGLGLSISRDLARLLGGEITVDSSPGRGSTFTLVLPEQYAEPAARGAPPQPQHRTRAPSAGLAAAIQAPAAAAGAPVARAPAAQTPAIDDRDRLAPGGRSILVIEDDLPFAQILADLAREREFQAMIALSAEEGLDLAIRHRPSAIVLDVGLPDRSGLSVLDALKHDPATRHIPVHMMSAADHAQTALQMGAVGYALKPVQREELEAAFRRLEAKLTQELRRVLVVEDDEVHRQSTCRLLAGDGVECVGVGTAADALAQLAAATFDSMVLDLTLPDKSGFELLEEMAAHEGRAFPPVIVYTGRSLSRDEEQRLRRFSQSIIIKGARSPERLLDEVTLFLHQVESELPADRQRMLRDARHREAVFEGRRILIVEDDVRNVFALTSVLEPKGAKIEIARNGREALDHLRDHPGVDLVLMDIMMPEMDGLTATREIRRQPRLAKLPIIALTAKAMADDREGCLAAGANDYIAKPLDVDKLLSLARVWMPR